MSSVAVVRACCFDRWNHLEDEDWKNSHQKWIFHDRLHPLEIYDDDYDRNLQSCFNFPQAEILSLTQLLTADLESDPDINNVAYNYVIL